MYTQSVNNALLIFVGITKCKNVKATCMQKCKGIAKKIIDIVYPGICVN